VFAFRDLSMPLNFAEIFFSKKSPEIFLRYRLVMYDQYYDYLPEYDQYYDYCGPNHI
jgi:hypothetical protein